MQIQWQDRLLYRIGNKLQEYKYNASLLLTFNQIYVIQLISHKCQRNNDLKCKQRSSGHQIKGTDTLIVRELPIH